MATEKQIRANRANAKKSSGPVTAEGKSASSKNAARHRLLSSDIVLKGESIRLFNQLAEELTSEFQPRTSAETALLEIMVNARWRLKRVWGIQSAGLDLEMARQDSSAGPSDVIAALAFKNLADNSRFLDLLHRYEVSYDRQFNRALATLMKLRAQSPVDESLAPPPSPIPRGTWEANDPDFPNEADLRPAEAAKRSEGPPFVVPPPQATGLRPSESGL